MKMAAATAKRQLDTAFVIGKSPIVMKTMQG